MRETRSILGRFFAGTLAWSVAFVPALADTIWIEGEDAQKHGVRRHGWYDSVTRDALSGGDWLSNFQSGDAPEAEYVFEVTEPGLYHFWIRCNPIARARLSYRLGDERWKEVDLSRTIGSTNIASDGKPDMRFVAWVQADPVELRRGTNTIRFRFHSANSNHGAIDCFLLSRRPFRPRGILKPGERSGRANPGFFAWEPDTDSFGQDALVDLSFLNEETAGESGRVRAKGQDFVLGSGGPVKFWATNAGPGIWRLDHDSHVYLARRLAKAGVNMVRLHGSIYGSRDPSVDRRRLDGLHHLVHALRSEGIYVSLSFFFPLWFRLDREHQAFMVLFFDKEMQDLYRGWAKKLLGTRNPYTKLPLGRDPAVAIVEIVNEDSHFFWTFGKKNTTAKRWNDLKSQYGAWLKKKYGSFDRAFEAWSGVREDGDDPGAGRIELYGAWEMTAAGQRARPKTANRVRDQVEFLTGNMRGFYLDTIRFFERECGYSGLVSCGNWHVSDPAVLDALERYCYTAGDVIDHHGYFDRGHEGEASSWSVRPGHRFSSQSALHLKTNSPIPFVETEGHPHIISEIGWPTPNMYRAEFSFLTSAYGSLQGRDGIFSFALGSAGWDERLGKFPVSTPVTLGSFPAAALIYRRGYVREAPIVVMDRLRVEDLYALKGTSVYVTGAFDQLRAASIPPGEEKRGVVAGIDPLTFYVGRVVRSFEGKPEDSYQVGVGEFIDRERKIVRSSTGELTWDYGRGLVTMNAKKAQGAAGFLGKAGSIELDDVTVRMENDYGTVTVVALDDRPVAASKKVLIQTMTIEQFYGFEATGPGNLSGRIESVGTAPCGVETFKASVTLRLEGEPPAKVVACDEHGYPRETAVDTSGGASGFKIELDASSPYHVVLR